MSSTLLETVLNTLMPFVVYTIVVICSVFVVARFFSADLRRNGEISTAIHAAFVFNAIILLLAGDKIHDDELGKILAWFMMVELSTRAGWMHLKLKTNSDQVAREHKPRLE